MTDDQPTPPTASETDANEAAATPAPSPKRRFDRTTMLLTAGAVAAVFVAFAAGHHSKDGDRHKGDSDMRRSMSAMHKGEGSSGREGRGGGERGHMQRGNMQRGGNAGGMGKQGMRGGKMGGHRGVMGVVTAAKGGTLTVAPLRGGVDEVTVTTSDDTTVFTRGDAGPKDIEEAKLADVTTGDVVMVFAERDRTKDDTTVAATKIMIAHNSDA